ncbi:hypothetical protein [Hyphomonas sp.]|uniref:hypothetical protein n=1 Tax=Hyphomonas sp. TaxID=87 RepID=UPI0035275956
MEGDWTCVETHAPTGRQIYQRTVEFRNTGNNEGTMDDAIEVREADGKVIASTLMSIEWEYFGRIDARFSEDGRTLIVTGTGEPREEIALPPAS